MTKNNLSVVISAYNEEERLAKTLETVAFADEIIVIDNSSTDKTAQIAKKYTKKVYSRPNLQMLNTNKNFGFTKATGEWILSLDADERVTAELQQEIMDRIQQTEYAGYWIPRKNIIFGKWIRHAIWWPDYQLRLFQKGKGKFPEKHVHEMMEVVGETAKLEHPLEHDNYSSVYQYMQKLNTIYTENEVANFISSGKKVSGIDAFRFPLQDFLKTYFAQKGYKDGLHGFVLCALQACYAEVVFAKIWEKQGFPEYKAEDFSKQLLSEAKKIRKEFRYWILTALSDEEKNSIKKTLYKIARKIL